MSVMFCVGDFGGDVEPSGWRVAVAELRSKYGEEAVTILHLSMGPTSDGPLASIPLNVDFVSATSAPIREIGPRHLEAFLDYLRSEEFGQVRNLAQKLLNRNDLTGTLRFLDREVVVHATVLSIVEVLIRRAPTLVVFPLTPHQFVPFLVEHVARFLGCQTLFFQPVPICHAVVPRVSVGRKLAIKGASVGDSALRDDLVTTAKENLGALRAGNPPKYMNLQTAREAQSEGVMARLKSLRVMAGWLRNKRFADSLDFSWSSRSHSVGANALSVILSHWIQKSLRERINRIEPLVSDRQAPYAIFALHYEPERTSIPEGLPIQFQAEAVIAARRLLPPHVRLLVKEHSSQYSSSLRGFAGRSPLFYDFLERIDGVVVLPPSASLTDMVPEATVVFTLTGTAAIESVFRGVPVGYFGHPWWEGMPGTIKISDLTSFDDVISTPVSASDAHSFLVDLVLQQAVPGVAGESLGVASRRIGSLPPGLVEAEGAAIVAGVEQLTGGNL
jgi:hypothetical protein